MGSIFTGLYSFFPDPGVPPGVHIRGTSFSDGDSRPVGDFRGNGGECCIPGDQIPEINNFCNCCHGNQRAPSSISE